MGGYNDIQNPPSRYAVIDLLELRRLCGITDSEEFKEQYRQRVDAALTDGRLLRESSWTESVAVGGRNFIEEIKETLGIKGIGRRVREQEEPLFALRESSAAYNADSGTEKGSLSRQNTYYWDIK